MSAVLLRREGAGATLLIDNPRRGNALTPAMMGEAAALVDGLARELEERPRPFGGLVLRGSGDRAFCGGYDFASLAEETRERPQQVIPELLLVLDAFLRFPAPTIAAMNGHAVGGGALLASLCDIRLARRGATFHVPTTRIGILYPLLGMRRLLALLGPGRAGEVLLRAAPIEAERALAWGLVAAVCDDAAALDRSVAALVADLAGRAPLAAAGTVLTLRALVAAAPEAEALHAAWLERCVASRDLAEGLAAAAARRAPEFEGA